MLLRGFSVRIIGGIEHNLAGSMRSSDGCGGQDYGVRTDACSWLGTDVRHVKTARPLSDG